jgi:type II secretory pathway predicted ATPase ExeA
MREFNTFGPVNPQYHYHVNRVAVKAAMRQKIEKGRYFTLNAARQTGKTTLFREVIAELEAEGAYFGVLLDFSSLKGFEGARLYERLGSELQEQARRLGVTELPRTMRDHGDFVDWLRSAVRQRQQPGVLIIDEFDSLPEDILTNMLSLFRAMYLARDNPGYHALHGIILVGVRNIPALLGGTQSPFNIADQFTVPYFTPAEVSDLLTQHTAETGQPFAPEVIKGITHETEGQPFLVNRLGQLLTQEIVPDRTRPITSTDLDYALALLVSENNTHFSSIRSKAALHRSEVIMALFNPSRYYDFQDEVTQDLLMYGVFRTLTDESGLPYARIANPIYRRMLVKAFAPAHPLIQQAANGLVRHQFVVNGQLDFARLLDGFKAFMEEHGVRLLRSEATGRPLEISGQYLLLSYLTAALKSIGGHVTVESLSSAGEMDILAFYRGQRYIVETKVWYGMATFEEGKAQLVAYLTAAGLTQGYLVIFDERPEANPLATQCGSVFEVTVGEKRLRVYLIAVQV